jgi:hypothetical protein
MDMKEAILSDRGELEVQFTSKALLEGGVGEIGLESETQDRAIERKDAWPHSATALIRVKHPLSRIFPSLLDS